jgi:hypothetical protein
MIKFASRGCAWAWVRAYPAPPAARRVAGGRLSAPRMVAHRPQIRWLSFGAVSGSAMWPIPLRLHRRGGPGFDVGLAGFHLRQGRPLKGHADGPTTAMRPPFPTEQAQGQGCKVRNERKGGRRSAGVALPADIGEWMPDPETIALLMIGVGLIGFVALMIDRHKRIARRRWLDE